MNHSVDFSHFSHFVENLRRGDQLAAELFVSKYAPEIRRFIRLRLTDPSLKRILESADVCQSVMANFFVLMAEGRYSFENPQKLSQLLMVMARHKLFDHSRRNRRRPDRHGGQDLLGAARAKDEIPFDIVMHAELNSRMQVRLDADEREIADLRRDGRDWPEIAAGRGVTADAVRKKLGRAMKRIIKELGIGP